MKKLNDKLNKKKVNSKILKHYGAFNMFFKIDHSINQFL